MAGRIFSRWDRCCSRWSTGQRAFAREHTIDTLHAILHEDPPELWQAGRDAA